MSKIQTSEKVLYKIKVIRCKNIKEFNKIFNCLLFKTYVYKSLIKNFIIVFYYQIFKTLATLKPACASVSLP